MSPGCDGAGRGGVEGFDAFIELDSGYVVYVYGETALVYPPGDAEVSCWRGPFRWEVDGRLVSDAAVEGELVTPGRVVSFLRFRS